MMIRTLFISLLLVSALLAGQNDALAMGGVRDTLRLTPELWAAGKELYLWELSWRYHPGDDPAWASPEFDDRTWEAVDVHLDSIPGSGWTGIGWYRLHVIIDSHFPRRSIGITGSHSGSIRIYWDGHLQLERLRFRLPNELLITPGHHVLAVRYELEDIKAPREPGESRGFFIRFGEFEKSVDTIIQQKAEQMFFVGLALAFGMLHIALFLFSPSSRANLIYALFLFFFAVTVYADIQQSYLSVDWVDANVYRIAHRAAVPAVSILFLLFLYSIFYPRIPRQFWFLAGMMAVLGVIIVLQPVANYRYYVGGSVVFTVEMVRVLVVAVWKQKPGAWIIANGFVFMGIFSAYDDLLDLDLIAPIGQITNAYYFGVVGLVAATSLYLSREFSLTSRRLVEQVKRTQEEEIARRLVETDNARKTRELEEARQLQLSLLPSCRNDLSGLDACFQMETASEVGGDYYDYHSSPDGSVTVVVGDATGHGMRAGTMVSIIKGLFVTHVPIGDVPAFLRKCSEAIKEMRLGNLFMGLTVAKIRNGALTLSSAGMPPVLLFRSASRSVEDIVIKSMPLGGPGPQMYEVREATLFPGDVVLLMSDGLPELFNPEGEILDYPAVRRFLAESADGSATEIANSLQEQGRRWAAGKSPGDDITLVVLKKT